VSSFYASRTRREDGIVGIALVNHGPEDHEIGAVMRLELPGKPSETDAPIVSPDYFLAMVVGYILVGMLLPIVAVLAICLFISRRARNRLGQLQS
jgi:hypothetical protein